MKVNSGLRLTGTFIFLLCIPILFSACKVGRFIVYNFADIKDYKKFPSRPLSHSQEQFTFSTARSQKVPKNISNENQDQTSFEDYLEKNKTVAFLVIQNDSIKYEKYFKGYDQTAIVPSFSMAKSITAILIGCAVDEGLIQSTQEPITNYIPELKKNGFDAVTIKHLLQMTSGIKFNEGYTNPFGEVATFYYGTNLRKAISKMTLKRKPGSQFEYVSGNTQLLGLVLERAIKTKTITQYLQDKLWQPLGMEYDASWSIDRRKNGLEKTFCCINARARDFAKIGRLYLNQGNWSGKQIVSKQWVLESTKPSTVQGSAWYYQNQWWLPSKNGDFMAAGILGQYVYVNPAKNMIIVRLGQSNGKADWEKLFINLASKY